MTSGLLSSARAHRFLTVARFPHHLEAVSFREQGADPLAHDDMVVDNQNTHTRV